MHNDLHILREKRNCELEKVNIEKTNRWLKWKFQNKVCPIQTLYYHNLTGYHARVVRHFYLCFNEIYFDSSATEPQHATNLIAYTRYQFASVLYGKHSTNFISSGSKIVKRLRRRQYDPLIIERTIGLVHGPSTALYIPSLECCTLTNKTIGTIWRALPLPPKRR